MPLLGDIPSVGRLFRSERDQVTTTELVILLRPLVVAYEDLARIGEEACRSNRVPREERQAVEGAQQNLFAVLSGMGRFP
jgi:type II secretory pathway component GspD/PulD (secretin)